MRRYPLPAAIDRYEWYTRFANIHFMTRRAYKNLIILALVAGALSVSLWKFTRPKPVAVVVKKITPGRVEDTVANTRAGTVNACRRARLAPVMGGQISRLPVREGDQVKTGQVLLELWNLDRAAELLLAQREATAAKARTEEACVTASVAASEAKRLSQLRKKGLTSEEDTERAVGNARAREAACEAARASTEVSNARIEVANVALERTILRAPFDGTIAELNGELGEVVTPSPIGVATLPAVDLIDDRCQYITAPIDEVDAPEIRAGMRARITLDAFKDKSFEGKVRRVAPYVMDREKQARTVDIEVDFSNAEDTVNMLPGYSADVEVMLDARDDVLRVPTEALLEDKYVLVYSSEDGTLERRKVTTGLSNWIYTEVLSGLQSGEYVVTSVDRKGVEDGVDAVPENGLDGTDPAAGNDTK